VLDGVVGLALPAVIAVLIPVSSQLSRRLVIFVSLSLAWVPLLWWVPLDVPGGRVSLLLAVATGALAAWFVFRPAPLRRVLPEVRGADLAPVLAGLGTAWLVWPILNAASGDRTLNLLIKSGWDHAAHFAMVHLMRAEGLMSPFLGDAPDGSGWVGADYPQHFHATLATIEELIGGDRLRSSATEVLAYGQALSLLSIAGAVGLAAGVAQLRSLRSRSHLALPLAAVVVATFFIGPGVVAFSAGWPNLIFASLTTALAVLVAAGTHRYSAGAVAALGGLVVATAHGWVMMAPLAAVALLVALPRTRLAIVLPPGRRNRVTVAALVVLAVVLTLAVLPVLSSSGAGGALTGGGVAEFSIPYLVLFLGGALIATSAPLVASGLSTRPRWELWSIVALPVACVGFLASFAGYQLLSTGELAYYFGKLAIGVTLVAAASIAVGVDSLVPVETRPSRQPVLLGLGVVGTLAVTQFFGYVGPTTAIPQSPAPMIGYRDTALVLMAGPSGESLRLLAAADRTARADYGTTTYVAGVVGDPNPVLADQWSQALSLSYSGERQVTVPFLDVNAPTFSGPDQAAESIRKLVRADPQRIVLVDTTWLEELRPLLGRRVLQQVQTL
jgi:hypothetical protein